MKKIILTGILSATVLFGLPTFIRSNYFALLSGNLDLYYKLEATDLAVDYCDAQAGNDDVVFELCMEPAKSKFYAELRK